MKLINIEEIEAQFKTSPNSTIRQSWTDIATLLDELKRLRKLRDTDKELIDTLRTKIQKSRLFSQDEQIEKLRAENKQLKQEIKERSLSWVDTC